MEYDVNNVKAVREMSTRIILQNSEAPIDFFCIAALDAIVRCVKTANPGMTTTHAVRKVQELLVETHAVESKNELGEVQ